MYQTGQLLGVFESNDTSEPDLPSITMSGFSEQVLSSMI